MAFKKRFEREKEMKPRCAEHLQELEKARKAKSGEVQLERQEPVKIKSARDVIDIILTFLPGVAAVFGIAKWFGEIVRCISGGVYKEQLSSCTKPFSLDFLPRYYEPILLWIAGVSIVVCLVASLVRFFIWAKKGKKVAVVVLFLLSLLCAVPFLTVWRLHDHYDAPATQAFLRFVGEDRIRAFFQAYPWVYKSAFPYITLGLSALFMLIVLAKILRDDDSGNYNLSLSLIPWAAVIFLGIPLLILLTQNAVLAILLAVALVMVVSLFSRILRILIAVLMVGAIGLAVVTTMSFAPLIAPAILVLIIIVVALLPSSGARGSGSSDDSEENLDLYINELVKDRNKAHEKAGNRTGNLRKGALYDAADIQRQIEEKCAKLGKDLLDADPATLDKNELIDRIKKYERKALTYENDGAFAMGGITEDRKAINQTLSNAYHDAAEKLRDLLYKIN